MMFLKRLVILSAVTCVAMVAQAGDKVLKCNHFSEQSDGLLITLSNDSHYEMTVTNYLAVQEGNSVKKVDMKISGTWTEVSLAPAFKRKAIILLAEYLGPGPELPIFPAFHLLLLDDGSNKAYEGNFIDNRVFCQVQ